MAAAIGKPELANVFYYGKEFGAKKRKPGEKERYKELSVTKAGALGEQIEEQQIAQEREKQENPLEQLLAQSDEGTSLDDLLNIIGRGCSISWDDIKKLFAGTSPFGVAGQTIALGGAGALLNKMLGGGGGGYAGYQGGIPSLTASRQMLPIPQTVTNAQGQTVPRRPGSGGITYFSPMSGSTLTDQGLDPNSPGDTGGATGGLTSLAGGGRFLRGGGDGVSDSIPAKFTATGKPAALADGEFVLDARTVSEIGNGSSEAGARKLYAFMKAVHGARKKAGRGSKSGADKHLQKLLA